MNEVIPFLVAHRGYPGCYPENTLEGITASLQAGACFVEFDVQLSADGVPVVIHDQNMRRTAGIDLSIADTRLEELRRYSVGEAEHLQKRFSDTRIPTLHEVITLFRDWPRAQAVIEIKRSSLRRFGRDTVRRVVDDALQSLRERSIIISFDHDVIADFIRLGTYRAGWIIDEYTVEACTLAEALQPDYLVCKEDLLPEGLAELWQGAWQWMVYTIDDPDYALELAQRGVHLVETDAIGEMLTHPLLKQKTCHHENAP